VGGFHGFRKYSYLEGIDTIGACHCISHVKAIKKRFPNNYNMKLDCGENLSEEDINTERCPYCGTELPEMNFDSKQLNENT